MNLWLWAAVILMILTAAILLAGDRRLRPPPAVQRRFAEVLREEGINASGFFRFERRGFGERLQSLLERFSAGELDEMQRLLVQAGLTSASVRLTFLLIGWLAPTAAALLAGANALVQGLGLAGVLMHGLFAFAIVFIGLRRLLRWRAHTRRQTIRKEVVTFLHLLRMLFDAGLSFEHILQVIGQQGRDLIPNLASELSSVLQRIQAGRERGEALSEMAGPLEVPELNDTVAMLKQVTRYGGNIRDSLVEYTELVEQRQISELREYVSKLSAKMTIVMVVFLFPALMIFVAGPGFVGLADALRGLR